MYKYIVIFFVSFSFNSVFSQQMLVKWENIIEGDTSVAKFVQPVRLFLDNNENGFIYLFNNLYLNSILKINPQGDLDYNKNVYDYNSYKKDDFRRSSSQNEKQVVFSQLPTVNAIRFAEIVTTRNSDLANYVLKVVDFIDSEESPFAEFISNATESDYLVNPSILSNFRNSTFLCFQDSRSMFQNKILKIANTGNVRMTYDVMSDSIFQNQQVVDGVFDSSKNFVAVLSGNNNIVPKSHPLSGLYSAFQLRTFTINLSNDSLHYQNTFTFTPNSFKDSTYEYFPFRVFIFDEFYYILGNAFAKNRIKPFIAKIQKNGVVDDVTILDVSFNIMSATFSTDSSKIAFCGNKTSTLGGTKYYAFNVVEFDLNTKEFTELTYADDLIEKKLTSIQPYKNGDYAVTGLLAYPHTGLGYQPSYAFVARITHSATSTGDNQPLKTTVNVTPNPSSEMATVEFMSSPEASTIQLVDVKGNVLRTLYQKTTQNTHQSSVTFRVSDLANGMYYVVVGNGTKTLETVPLSIQK